MFETLSLIEKVISSVVAVIIFFLGYKTGKIREAIRVRREMKKTDKERDDSDRSTRKAAG